MAQFAEPDSLNYASPLQLYGESLLAGRRIAESLETMNTSVETLVAALGADHEKVLGARLARALALGYSGDLDEAAAAVEGVVAQGSESETIGARASYVRGVLRRLEGNHKQALASQQDALAGTQRADTQAEHEKLEVMAEIGYNHLELKDGVSAEEALREALRLSIKLKSHMDPVRAEVLVGLARIRLEDGTALDALTLLKQSDDFWAGVDPENRWAGEVALWLGRAHLALGRSDDAQNALKRAEQILSQSRIPSDAGLAKLAGAWKSTR